MATPGQLRCTRSTHGRSSRSSSRSARGRSRSYIPRTRRVTSEGVSCPRRAGMHHVDMRLGRVLEAVEVIRRSGGFQSGGT